MEFFIGKFFLKLLAMKKNKHINRCRCCNNVSNYIFSRKIFNKNVSYYDCMHCGYVQTENPFWLVQAYKKPITKSDTGIMQRNLTNLHITLSTLFLLDSLKKSVLDYAGGFGILARLLRDVGIDAYWRDPYCKNLICPGFEFNLNDKKDYGLITSFESFEHFVDPLLEIEYMFNLSPNILVSTEIIDNPLDHHINNWWYFGEEHGQHIGFFRKKTLLWIAKKYNKNYHNYGTSYHLFSESKINPYIWRLTLKFRKIINAIICRLLTPKAWDDHMNLKNK
jgi:hypothetical protein